MTRVELDDLLRRVGESEFCELVSRKPTEPGSEIQPGNDTDVAEANPRGQHHGLAGSHPALQDDSDADEEAEATQSNTTGAAATSPTDIALPPASADREAPVARALESRHSPARHETDEATSQDSTKAAQGDLPDKGSVRGREARIRNTDASYSGNLGIGNTDGDKMLDVTFVLEAKTGGKR